MKASPDAAEGFWAVVLMRAGTGPRHKADRGWSSRRKEAQWPNSAAGEEMGPPEERVPGLCGMSRR